MFDFGGITVNATRCAGGKRGNPQHACLHLLSGHLEAIYGCCPLITPGVLSKEGSNAFCTALKLFKSIGIPIGIHET